MARRTLPLALLVLAACAPHPTPADPAPAALSPQPPASPRRAERPLPYPVDVPPGYARALAEGTRTRTGHPGPRYWQNFASYDIDARLDATDRRLEGTARITYENRSPDTLRALHLDLAQNLHAAGAVRAEAVEVTGGVEVRRVAVEQQVLGTQGSGPRYAVAGTRLAILPPRPVPPGQQVSLEIDYRFALPKAGAGGRMGYSEDNLIYLAYWYPQMVVYDDVIGWHPDPFVGTTEFYADFANYRLALDVPAGWIVRATGRLTNAAAVLAPAVRERLAQAEASDTSFAVLAPADFAGRVTTAGRDGRLVWRFAADTVRDVAFSVTRNMHWDVRRTAVGDRDGDGRGDYTRIETLYRATAPRWRHAARYAAHAISFLSEYTARPYPWPHMTAVEGEGIIGGGMEYPMMTLIGGYSQATDQALYNVVAHELAHMWVPMMVSSDERRYSWLDEGSTTFHENMARADFFPGQDHHIGEQQQYLQIAGSGEEGAVMRRAWLHDSPFAYGIASYAKPATVLFALRGVLGEEMFTRAWRAFLDRWAYRHPYPWDLWHTFEDVSGRELDWFWRSWYYETWTLDQAVASVTAVGDSTRIVIEDRGRVPMPAPLSITLQSGQLVHETVPVEHWLEGRRQATVTVATPSPVVRVEIDAERAFPDADRGNNVWLPGG